MIKLKIVKIIACFVASIGFLVALGWIFNIDFLRNLLLNTIPMRFTTSLCFIASGIVLYAAVEEQKEVSLLVQIILPAANLFILLLMATSFIISVLGLNTGFDNIFFQQAIGTNNANFPDRPSMATMVNFLVIASAGVIILANPKKSLVWPGAIISFIGGVAILGYILSLPILSYSIDDISTSMAFSTAALFVLIGIGFILCGKILSKQN